jgi:hypothetical protein
MNSITSTEQQRKAHSREGFALSPWAGLGLGLVAAGIAWGVMQAVHPVFHVPQEFHAAMGAPIGVFERNRREQDRVDRRHAMLYVGGLGLLIGAGLGLGEWVMRRLWLPSVMAALLGALGGAAGGPLGCLVHEYVRQHVGQAELMHTIGAQLLLAAPLGLGVGLGLGSATRRVGGVLRTAFVGMAAGILAGIVYPIAVSIILPGASTDALLPEDGPSRMLWLAILAGTIGMIIPVAARRRGSRGGLAR